MKSIVYYTNKLKDFFASKQALTNISITGTTNNTGATIKANTSFFLNGALAKAKTDIANGATLTLNTNYVLEPSGALNDIGQVVTISDKFHIIRIGRLRVLSAEDKPINELTGITLGANDRPFATVKTAVSYYGFIGELRIYADGTISIVRYDTYGVNTPTDISTSTATVNFTIAWIASAN